MKKKILCVALTCAITAGLCACGNGSDISEISETTAEDGAGSKAAPSSTSEAGFDESQTDLPVTADSDEQVKPAVAADSDERAKPAVTADSEQAHPTAAADDDSFDEPDTGASNTMQKMYAKYNKALIDVIEKHVFPDGSECEFNEGIDTMSNNKFALCDVDGDGEEELIINYSTASMAGMVEHVYGYNKAEDKLYKEFGEFPSVTYYDNGIVIAQWSHNQGMSGEDFWPYNCYHYNFENDEYDFISSVDAISKELIESDSEIYGNVSYPYEVDKENAGMVYIISPENEYSSDNPVSQSDYRKWYTDNAEGGKQINIPYKSLTKKNVKKIK